MTERTLDLAEVGRIVEELFPEALGVWVYGSQANGTARPGSDIDIAVLPARPVDRWDLFSRAQNVASQLGREVDLVDLRGTAPDLLRFEAVGRGIRVAARDPAACDRFEIAALGRYHALVGETAGWFEDIVQRGSVF